MSLFQKIIVKKYLENLPSDLIEGNYKKYTKYFNDFGRAERIRALKEEQYQEGFLRELFVECLNYTINPNENFNLITEFKNKTDKEIDQMVYKLYGLTKEEIEIVENG